MYWDPLGEDINESTYALQHQDLLQKAEWYRLHPEYIKRRRNLLVLLAFSIITFYIIFFRSSDSIITVIIFSFAPVVLYHAIIHTFQQNLILYLLSKENNWIYNPDVDPSRYEKYKKLYPDIFNKGHSQEIVDQFWGSINIDDTVRFWSCAFIYVTGSGKSSTTHNHSIVILQLFNPIPINFDVKRKSALSFSGSRFKTESEEFNKLFEIKSKINDPQDKLFLFKILSPSVQVRLIEIATTFHIAQIGFHGTSLILDFNDDLWDFKYTNFFKEVRVDERDTEYFKNLLLMLTQIPIEMLHYID